MVILTRSEVDEGKLGQVVEYRKPTRISGVSAVLSFENDALDSLGPYMNADGYSLICATRLELSPDFHTQTLGITTPEAIPVDSTE